MAAPTPRRFVNVTTATHGTNGINTIQQISYDEQTQVIEDAGDADASITFLAKGITRVQGTLAIRDPLQARALRDAASADLAFSGQPGDGGALVNVAIKGCTFFGKTGQAMFNGVWAYTLPFRGFTVDGAPIVTEAMAGV